MSIFRKYERMEYQKRQRELDKEARGRGKRRVKRVDLKTGAMIIEEIDIIIPYVKKDKIVKKSFIKRRV